MSRLLIIGASILQLPAIKKAKELGHVVAVADYNPDAIGISYADKYYNASTIDIPAICDVAEDFRPDGIMTLATDMPMRSIAAATTLLGLPGISMDTAIKATDKWEMIKAFKRHGVESPWFYVVENENGWNVIKQQITCPCVLKPTDNAGSGGVILVETIEKLDEAYLYSKQQSREGKIIVEEYMRGDEISVEVIVCQGEVHILAVTDKLTTGAPYFVEMGHTQPSCLSKVDLLKIKDLTVRAVKAVGIEEGPAHVEIMLTDQGPKMIELGARMGGDNITTHLVPLSTGINMVEATIDVALGAKPDIEPKLHCCSAIRYFKVPCGVIKSIKGIEKAKIIPGIREITFTKSIGESVTPIHCSNDRVGFVIAQAETIESVTKVCEEAMKRIVIEIE